MKPRLSGLQSTAQGFQTAFCKHLMVILWFTDSLKLRSNKGLSDIHVLLFEPPKIRKEQWRNVSKGLIESLSPNIIALLLNPLKFGGLKSSAGLFGKRLSNSPLNSGNCFFLHEQIGMWLAPAKEQTVRLPIHCVWLTGRMCKHPASKSG